MQRRSPKLSRGTLWAMWPRPWTKARGDQMSIHSSKTASFPKQQWQPGKKTKFRKHIFLLKESVLLKHRNKLLSRYRANCLSSWKLVEWLWRLATSSCPEQQRQKVQGNISAGSKSHGCRSNRGKGRYLSFFHQLLRHRGCCLPQHPAFWGSESGKNKTKSSTCLFPAPLPFPWTAVKHRSSAYSSGKKDVVNYLARIDVEKTLLMCHS